MPARHHCDHEPKHSSLPRALAPRQRPRPPSPVPPQLPKQTSAPECTRRLLLGRLRLNPPRGLAGVPGAHRSHTRLTAHWSGRSPRQEGRTEPVPGTTGFSPMPAASLHVPLPPATSAPPRGRVTTQLSRVTLATARPPCTSASARLMHDFTPLSLLTAFTTIV